MRHVAVGWVLAGYWSGCASSGDPRRVDEATRELVPVVDSVNRFSFDMYRDVAADQDGNLFVSPFSMSVVLSMTLPGASGTTASELETVLGVTGDPSAWHTQFGALVRDLDGDRGRDYTLRTANALFGQAGYPWEPTFLAINADDYGAPMVPTNFASQPEAARSTINDWVATRTQGRIAELLAPDEVAPTTRMVLTSAVYFKAQWTTPFDPSATVDGTFTRLDGSTVSTPIMHMDTAELRDALRVGWTDDGWIAQIPYGDDADLSMVVKVPFEPDGLPNLEAALTASQFEAWLGALQVGNLDLQLPRFTMGSTVDGLPLLARLGAPSLQRGADLSAMTDPPGNDLAVATLVQQTFVQVDERGTEATAVTNLEANESGPIEVYATHPFLFVIRDDLTGLVLFVGRVVDPTSDGSP